jgi:hypothetical protein
MGWKSHCKTSTDDVIDYNLILTLYSKTKLFNLNLLPTLDRLLKIIVSVFIIVIIIGVQPFVGS